MNAENNLDILDNNATMTDAAKAARRAYYKKWAAANRDKLKANAARYWERKAARAETEKGA